jgi:threonine dehydrogenase-like Zn-dependent dehydrogenase
VLGIIGKDGCMSEYINLPVENLHRVPDGINDLEATFTEPLAAACRILEQKAVKPGQRVAVIGDGKFGLLIAQNLVVAGHEDVTHFGRHRSKLELVEGTTRELVADDTATKYAQSFDVCIEASGSSQGIRLAAALTRSLGTIVLKSTCSTVGDDRAPAFAAIANDTVVQELTLVGSRCGPFPPALKALQDARVKRLVAAMVSAEYSVSEGIEAIEKAKTKGVLKVVITMDG